MTAHLPPPGGHLPARWPGWFARRLGPGWPHTYACLDVETTGLRLAPSEGQPADVVTGFGWCTVVDGRVADRGAVEVDWTGFPGVDVGWLVGRLSSRAADLGGPPGERTAARLAAVGHPPADVAGFARDWTARLAAGRVVCLAHNGLGFDAPALAGFLRLTGVAPGWGFGPDALLDTLAVEVGDEHLAAADRPAGLPPELEPRPDDTAAAYCRRLLGLRRPGLHARLDDHCFAKYGFDRAGLRPADMHEARADAYCLSLMAAAWHAPPPAAADPGRWAGEYTGPPVRVRRT